MGRKYDYDYIIIGSGPAGSAAALELSKHKKHLALVEEKFFGGTNLNTRDIPYAVALDFAHTYHKTLSYPELKNQDFHFNLPSLAARQLQAIIRAGGNDQKTFESAGITCLKGFANLLDEHTVAIGNQRFTAKNFILATGSRLKIQEIAGTESVNYLTPETAIKIRRLPQVAAVVGGGSTGCEIAEYFAELGIKTILFETAERLLPREDKEVGDTISDYFSQHLSITVLPNSRVVALEKDEFSKKIIFRHHSTEKSVRVDCIVLATGSQPNLDYGLENAGVKYKKTGIAVNKLFETSAKNIYAIGDAIGEESSTERAHQEGLTLAHNLIHKTKNPLNYQGFVRSTKTFPEVTVIGLSEDDLIRRDRKYKKSIVKLAETPVSKIYDLRHGFIKLLANRNNHLIGAIMVAPHAELIASELSVAIRHHLTALELASTPHPINNYGYLIKLAAKQLLSK